MGEEDRIHQIGIDEAGYAPTLGPLVVSAVSLARPRSACDLYAELDSCLGRPGSMPRQSKGDGHRKLAVGDSKKIYSKTTGLANLERSVLAFARVALGREVSTDLELAEALTGGTLSTEGLAWYEGQPTRLPLEADAGDIAGSSERLSQAMHSAGLEAFTIRSRLVTARDFNAGVSDVTNKADLLASIVSGLLQESVPLRGESVAAVDRLGGRKDYRSILERTWSLAQIAEIEIGPERSSYSVRGGSEAEWDCRISFACKAEDSCALVALASMTSKYLRELFVRRFNAWFVARRSGLAPTAGYPVDAARFLEDTAELRSTLGIPDALFVRSR